LAEIFNQTTLIVKGILLTSNFMTQFSFTISSISDSLYSEFISDKSLFTRLEINSGKDLFK